jgi:hypothetical protein
MKTNKGSFADPLPLDSEQRMTDASNRIHYMERLFSRSCLDAPLAIFPVRFLSGAAPQPQHSAHFQLHQLKQRLLRAALESTPDTQLFKKLCGAANQAAEQAWATPYPQLVLPCLFEELVEQIRNEIVREPALRTQANYAEPAEWPGTLPFACAE